MDISAALTPAEVALLSEPERPCEDAASQLDRHQAADGIQGEREDGELLAAFEQSLRVKNTLDAFEELASTKPSWQTLSVLVNCEYRLYTLNQSTRLRNNPFLSHWVETIQRIEKPAAKSIAQSDEGIQSSHVHTVRVELIKALLETRSPSQFASKSPKQLYAHFIKHLSSPTRDFNLRTYIRMLEEEDIYERTPEPPSPPQLNSTPSKPPNPHQWKYDIFSKLQTDPSTATQELTHLPIELSSLDFLTTLLQEKTLTALNIDPAPIISDYIQHALRLVEKMGQPPPIHASGPSSADFDIGPEDMGDGDTNVLEHGKEAQTRAVKLLLLFMRNLIRKELVQVEAIYFEIQEICVRFVWIREVREFRAFIEGGGAFG